MVSARGTHGRRPRRRLRRGLTVAALVVAAIAVAGGAAYALRGGDEVVDAQHHGRDPRAVVQRFATAWAAGDYRTMYRQLTARTRPAGGYAEFARAYRAAASVATLGSVSFKGGERVSAGVGFAPLALHTRDFGVIDANLALPVVRVAAGYRVAWTPQLVWPGLTTGEHLARRAEAPTTRGAILGRDLSVLAGGAPDAREYPQGAAFSLITGYVAAPDTAGKRRSRARQGWPASARYGQGGLEASLDDTLAGAPRVSLVAAGASGSRLLARHPGRRPRDVVTTLDVSLQETATTLLAGRLGGIVVLDARSGALRAAAGLGLDGRQPPGSTFKIVTASAALTSHTAALDTYYPPLHYAMLGGFKLRNFHGELCGGSLIDSFAHSCNSVFAPLAIQIGAQNMSAMANAYGFSRTPTIAYPTPESVMPRPALLDSDVDLGVTGIGQGGVTATPLQMASVGQVIAARGVIHPPWLVQRPRPRSDRSSPRRVITRGVADQVAEMMRAVVSYGTGTAAQSSIATVNGKTGTAEVGPGKADAWFVGYAPAEAPRVVVSV
ncbi:MAG: penicillin-binding protein, partial [Gaiellales bacterium]|nr:penicillin-binding protein [Gaiellales bacterium]